MFLNFSDKPFYSCLDKIVVNFDIFKKETKKIN